MVFKAARLPHLAIPTPVPQASIYCPLIFPQPCFFNDFLRTRSQNGRLSHPCDKTWRRYPLAHSSPDYWLHVGRINSSDSSRECDPTRPFDLSCILIFTAESLVDLEKSEAGCFLQPPLPISHPHIHTCNVLWEVKHGLSPLWQPVSNPTYMWQILG